MEFQKYKQLLRIEEELGVQLNFLGKKKAFAVICLR